MDRPGAGLAALSAAIFALAGVATLAFIPTMPPPLPASALITLAPGRAYDRAVQHWRRLPRAVPLASIMPGSPASHLGSVSGRVWKPIGPSPIAEPGCCA